jgi:hypothetical protein
MKLGLLLPLLLITACAQPKYADDSPAAAPTNPPGADGHASPACFRSGICLTFAWEKVPTEEDFGSFTFQTSRNGTPEDLSPDPSVVLWMPSMGHGSSPVTVTHLATGSYHASQVFFTMKGGWQIRFQLKDGGTVKDELALPYIF